MVRNGAGRQLAGRGLRGRRRLILPLGSAPIAPSNGERGSRHGTCWQRGWNGQPVGQGMGLSVWAPVIGLALVSWVVPWLWSRILPEGVGWLLVIGLLSTAVLALVSAVGFYVLYGEAGATVLRGAPLHFALLSAKAGLLWGPVMVLSLANLPRGWKTMKW